MAYEIAKRGKWLILSCATKYGQAFSATGFAQQKGQQNPMKIGFEVDSMRLLWDFTSLVMVYRFYNLPTDPLSGPPCDERSTEVGMRL